MITLFFVVILIFSVIIHEISHGYIALKLGDTTARDAGRLTLNPMAHIDVFGSILLPLMMALIGGPVFGWAKPVPYDPRFLKNPKAGAGLIAAAGPASNLLVAIIFALISRGLLAAEATPFIAQLYLLVAMIVQVNVALAIFNLLPIPPLDGSGVLFSLLPRGTERFQYFLRRYGFIFLIIFIFAGLNILVPLLQTVYRFLLGPHAPFV